VRLHVVHVLHSLAVGGTENGVVNLINAPGDGLRHTVVSMTEAGPLAARLPADVSVHCLGKRPGVDLRAIGRLTALLRRLRPHVVHSRNWGAFDAVVAARLAGVPRVIHGEHGREVSDPHGRDPRRNRLRRLLAPLVTRFVTVSLNLQEWLVGSVGIPRRKVLTIHNGVDTARFSDEGREEARRALGLPPELIVVGTVGRLDPVKDQVGLLEAFARIAGQRPAAALLIVGDGPCRKELEACAGRPELARRVHLLGERADVPRVLKTLDLYVLPSIAEGISNTILEAMATGLPVVATRTGGNPELVEDGVTGALVPVGDREALAQAILSYANDLHLRVLHGKAGRQRAVDQFALDGMVGRYRDLYRSVALREERR
jgi:sugar transferase (PEP-CTERM/EpsH1 system associated)